MRSNAFFGDSLETILLCRHEPMHVAAQEKAVGKTADRPEWRLPFKRVAHGGDAVIKFECVDVTQPFEGSLNYIVVESPRRVERGDARDEALLDDNVPAFESDEVAEFE